jgi:hypothetical protein
MQLATTKAPRSYREAVGPGRPLSTALLYRPCDPSELPFELVSEPEDLAGPIGQDRAVEAVEFAVQMRRKGYNIYALGPRGTGKHTTIEELLRQRAAAMPTPPDWCYVNNFADSQKPRRLQLPSGRAVGLREAMRRLVEELRSALLTAFERDDYRARRDVIDQQFRGRNEEAFGELQRRAEQKGDRRRARGTAPTDHRARLPAIGVGRKFGPGPARGLARTRRAAGLRYSRRALSQRQRRSRRLRM